MNVSVREREKKASLFVVVNYFSASPAAILTDSPIGFLDSLTAFSHKGGGGKENRPNFHTKRIGNRYVSYHDGLIFGRFLQTVCSPPTLYMQIFPHSLLKLFLKPFMLSFQQGHHHLFLSPSFSWSRRKK